MEQTPTRKLWNEMESLAMAINRTHDSTIRALTHVMKLGIDEKITTDVQQDNVQALEKTLLRLKTMSKEFDEMRKHQAGVCLWFGRYPGEIE